MQFLQQNPFLDLSDPDNLDMSYKVGNPATWGGSSIKTNFVSGETQALSQAVIKEQRVFVNIASHSRASNLPLGCAWMAPCCQKSENPRGLFFAAQKLFGTGKEAEKPSKSSLFSAKGMPHFCRPTVQPEHGPRNTWGWGGGTSKPKCFHFTLWMWFKEGGGVSPDLAVFVCALLFISCMWFLQGGKGDPGLPGLPGPAGYRGQKGDRVREPPSADLKLRLSYSQGLEHLKYLYNFILQWHV